MIDMNIDWANIITYIGRNIKLTLWESVEPLEPTPMEKICLMLMMPVLLPILMIRSMTQIIKGSE